MLAYKFLVIFYFYCHNIETKTFKFRRNENNVYEKEKLGIWVSAKKFFTDKIHVSKILKNKEGILKCWSRNDNFHVLLMRISW